MLPQDPYASETQKRWEQVDKQLKVRRQQAWLNRCFYLGHQWLWWDQAGHLRTVRELAPQSTRVRSTHNLIRPRVDAVTGRMLQRTLTFESMPSAADDATVGAARLAETVLDDRSVHLGWESVRDENLLNVILDSTACVSVEWDPNAGKKIVDDAELGAVFEGDVTLTPWSVTEFGVEPGSRSWTDARWWIGQRMMPPEQAQERWNLDFTPQPDGTGVYGGMQKQVALEMGSADPDGMCRVFVYYERPNRSNPQGKHCVVIGGRTVYESPWPFPFTDRLNLYVFRQTKVSGRWFGATYLDDAYHLQVVYNFIRSCIQEHAKKVSNVRIIAPHGAMDDDQEMTDTPGEIINYYPEAGGKPEFMDPPDVGRQFREEADRLEREMDDATHAHATVRGVNPGERASGYAIAQISERNDTPLSEMARDQAFGWAALAEMALELYQQRVILPRDAGIDLGDGVPLTVRWTGRQLLGQTKVHVPLDSTLPQSRAALIAQLESLKQTIPEMFVGVTQDQWSQMIDLPGRRMLLDADVDVARAKRENHLMVAGEVVVPEKWEDHTKHMSEHNDLRSSESYRNSPPEVRQTIDLHIEAHARLLQEEVARAFKMNQQVPGMGQMPQATRPFTQRELPSAQEQAA